MEVKRAERAKGVKGTKGPKGSEGIERDSWLKERKRQGKKGEGKACYTAPLPYFKRGLLLRKGLCMYTRDAFCSSLAYMHLRPCSTKVIKHLLGSASATWENQPDKYLTL